ncbi:MAG: site-specific integrase [Lachnospiraceae bacterium]|nr:site-specific integrase [Lachnospiraceae bacterium]
MLETNHNIYANTEESKCQKGFSSGVLCCQQQILIKELAELWFLDIKNIMRPSSYAIYQSYANKYILPYIGNIQADMFNADILSSLLGSYCKGNGKGGVLSQYTVYLLESMVRSMFHYGVKKKLVQEIPFGKAEFITIKKKEAVPLSELEIQQLLYVAEKQGRDIQLQISIPIYTGVTLSELCGLKWEDINLETGEIYVHRNMVRIQHNMPASNSTDNQDASTVLAECELPENMCRKFIIPERLGSLLKTEAFNRKPLEGSYVAELDKKAGRKKSVAMPGDAPDGRTLQYRLKTAGEKAGIKGLTFKTLRDTFAVLCLQAGGDVYSLAYVMGSGIPAMCDRYGQWMVRNDGFLKGIG